MEWIQAVKATFCADDHPGITLHGKGDQKDFSCLPFFLLFVSPLFWSGTNSAASGANNAGSLWPL